MTLLSKSVAWPTTIIAVGFISWVAMGIPIPEYRRLLGDGDTFTLNRNEWACASERPSVRSPGSPPRRSW